MFINFIFIVCYHNNLVEHNVCSRTPTINNKFCEIMLGIFNNMSPWYQVPTATTGTCPWCEYSCDVSECTRLIYNVRLQETLHSVHSFCWQGSKDSAI